MKKAIKIIIAVILWLFALLIIIGGAADREPGIVVFGIIFALIGLKLSGLLPKDKERAKIKEEEKIREKERLEEMGFLESVNLTLESGLSIPEKTLCKLTYYKDRIIIEGSGVTYNLPTNKLIDINIKTNTEIETFYNSSIAGAVGGALVLGPLGAIIGGRKKKKEIRKTEYFLVITYDKDDEVNFIVFNIDNNPLKVNKIVKIFKESGVNHRKTVDL